MRLKLSDAAFLITFVFVLTSITTHAQIMQVSGKVTLKQADGTVVPVKGAQIDIYRTDIKQKYEGTTDPAGFYAIAGVPVVGTYTIVISARGATPEYRQTIRFIRQPINNFTLLPGDGTRPTLEQIRTAELNVETKAIEEKNREITRTNEIVARTFQAGNAALQSGRNDEAVTQYREGLAARPDEPALLTNLSEALIRRGAERYNAAVKQQPPQKAAGIETAKTDWSEAARSSRKAIEISSQPVQDPAQQQAYERNKLVAVGTYARAMRLVATKVDHTQAQAAWDASQAYLTVETDPLRKAKIRNDALEMLFEAGEFNLTIKEARNVIGTNQDDPTANRVLSLALFASGDKNNFQEAADRLQRYIDLTPSDSDPRRVTAIELLDFLRTAEKITPRGKQASSTGRP